MDGQPGNGLQQVRVSDAEREAIVARLNDATSEGRLTLEEFSERVTQALAARTRGDLDVVVHDLPQTAFGAPARPSSAGRNVAQVTIGSVKRRGRWRLDRAMKVGTVVGSIKLDLRDAEITAPETDMTVESVVGSVKIWVPYGIAVDVDGHSVLGSRSVAEDSPRPGAPLLRLRINTVLGSVKVYRV
ncbi:MAG TPA: DUF1707 domain-containing protein [Micromonosporaceae bacterium]